MVILVMKLWSNYWKVVRRTSSAGYFLVEQLGNLDCLFIKVSSIKYNGANFVLEFGTE